MDTLRSIECFVQTVEAGSIAEGAKRLGISPAAASQSIRRLESHLSVCLLTRTTRSMTLTDAGTTYYTHVKNIGRDIEMARNILHSMEDEPCGRLRIASSATILRNVLTPLIPIFNDTYPHISLELLTAANDINEKEDVVRITSQLEDSVTSCYICSFPFLFCASPGYLERAGTPNEPEKLKNHDCLVFRSPQDGQILSWRFQRDGIHFEPNIRATMICDDFDILTQIALAGGGVSQLPAFVVQPYFVTGDLVPLFETDQSSQFHVVSETIDIYLNVSDRLFQTRKIKALIGFLGEQLSKF